MALRLRDLIRSVRACKTAADERASIARECADIRKAFKEEDQMNRTRNIAKLMYIHMLGYPTHWGQMECVKLVASPSYAEKRIGYLGLMVLLDEKQEVLMLVTNSLKNDLSNTNQFIVGLALCTLGNLSSPEMARDLAMEVEKLLSHSNPYIRKKAALCAVRIIRKVPELAECFIQPSKNLISDRSHGVLLTGITLILEICKVDPEAGTKNFRPYIHDFLRILRNLMQSTYSPDHDVSGFTDPFLQSRIIRLLRYLGNGNSEMSEVMTDVLAQIINNTETVKSVGSALLYECVLTIMGIDCNPDLKTLGVNTLGKFLTNKDNNTRFVSLNTLNRVFHVDIQALNRHKAIIIECLRDPDISIRQRALELTYALADHNSVQPILKELLSYLTVSEPEFRGVLVEKICSIAEKFSPSKRFLFDTIFEVMLISGAHVKDETVSLLIHVVSSNESLHGYATAKLYQALMEEYRSKSLVQSALWCLGEYGHHLVTGVAIDDTLTQASELDIISLVNILLHEREVTLQIQQYALNALVKLTGRFSESYTEKIKGVLEQYQFNINTDIQQRSCEYLRILPLAFRNAVVEQMPLMEESVINSKRDQSLAEKSNGVASSGLSNVPVAAASSPAISQQPNRTPTTSKPSAASEVNLLDFDLLTMTTPTTNTFVNSGQGQPASTSSTSSKSGADFLLDILGGPLVQPTQSFPVAAPVIPLVSSQPAFNPLAVPQMGSVMMPMMPMPALHPQPTHAIPAAPTGVNSATLQPAVSPYDLGFLLPTSTPPTNPVMTPSVPAYLQPNPYAGSAPLIPTQPTAPLGQSAIAPTVSAPIQSMPAPVLQTNPNSSIVAYQKDVLSITFDLQKSAIDPSQTVINAKFANSSVVELANFVFQVAVPKYLQMKIGNPSGRSIPAQGFITQQIQITNTLHTQKPLLMKAKVNYAINSSPVQDQFDVANFPHGF